MAVEVPDSEVAFKELFNSDAKQELYKALIDSINSENLEPLKQLLNSKESKISAVSTYAKMLIGEMKDDGVSEEIKNEINAIQAKVDQELLKNELEKTNTALKIVNDSAKADLINLNEKDKALIESHQNNLNQKIQEIDDYLKAPIQELNLAFQTKVPNEDQSQIDKVIKSIFK